MERGRRAESILLPQPLCRHRASRAKSCHRGHAWNYVLVKCCRGCAGGVRSKVTSSGQVRGHVSALSGMIPRSDGAHARTHAHAYTITRTCTAPSGQLASRTSIIPSRKCGHTRPQRRSWDRRRHRSRKDLRRRTVGTRENEIIYFIFSWVLRWENFNDYFCH